MPLLSVSDLTVTFDDFTAVDSANFAIEPGETLGVVGESGSGKSVTALSIMRLVEMGTRAKITGGRVDLQMDDGSTLDLLGQDEATMRSIRGNQIAMIFQEPLTSLNPVYPVGEQIAEALRIHQGSDRKASMARAREMFDLVRIPEADKRIGQYPHEMSGGMRQRIMIAIGLCCGPRLLIADEPTTALDVTIQAQILGLIKQLQVETGTAMMLITHDMGVIAEVADRVVVMNQAKIVEQGPVEQIFHSPRESYTRGLLSAVPKLGSMAGHDGPRPFNLAGNLA
ncbi:MAG: ABC transporter ATP-binding protein [Acidimicrobiales bacterium]|jgi:glutathione transport system ATP-binding protein|nr:ABC transporter ATP-binding protein [Acidimicrobiales bacterium]MDP6286446.1 ABC transporter ATP-binding protein [Acidimicrobiales bacterium]MDP6912095.1 ABC transporter ATP-binding protein [Acidimicrobiales bacterium]HJM72304.1 ABC transporter ATP-binding protein [Acidimicrobiales bacterium]|tara:strand:- start:1715 stop:2563 length:849 start_codon:yes stop_codon:yes gene_type:complete